MSDNFKNILIILFVGSTSFFYWLNHANAVVADDLIDDPRLRYSPAFARHTAQRKPRVEFRRRYALIIRIEGAARSLSRQCLVALPWNQRPPVVEPCFRLPAGHIWHTVYQASAYTS